MYAEWIVAGLTFPGGSIEQQLTAATALVPPKLLADSGLAEDIEECITSRYLHFWMNSLQDLGQWAEQLGRDGELPQEFWVQVGSAAHAMEFPQFVPYLLGKANGLPRQDPGDLMAALATLPAIPGASDTVGSVSTQVATILRTREPDAAPLLDRSDLAGLAQLLRDGAYDRNGEQLSVLFSEAFDELFTLVVSPGFPNEYARHAWAIVGPNPFRVVVADGLHPRTEAEVWWRA